MKTPTKKRRCENEEQIARCQGVEVLQNSGEEDNEYGADDRHFNINMHHERSLPQRGRPPKIRQNSANLLQSPCSSRPTSVSPSKKLSPNMRRKREEQIAMQRIQRIQAESFVMKLFDRSLDLSRYTECTELYPICRAWMMNQPRNPNIHCIKRRSSSPMQRSCNGLELLTRLRRGEIREITAMPAPEETGLTKVPPVEQLKDLGSVGELHNLENCSKDEILALHQSKWKRVKSNWLKHSKQYQQRYELNHLIIKELFKP